MISGSSPDDTEDHVIKTDGFAEKNANLTADEAIMIYLK